ncbi:MAG: tryptophanyl-tRNA synthetase, tryptophanyl-tRNA synthetase [Candidatus Saccharibacteria bacterium]|nr:tryptophanyl-tRNA synthetase, tryptophanyl-tRNA synthetase [Candidatus Saccharibacteria bacterium]
MTKPVILTGLRANNDLTIGNYLGAMLPTIEMAKKYAGEYQINMFIPDLHSFTTPIDHEQLLSQITNNAKFYAAAGLPLDNDNIIVYRQSYVPAHSELTWILDCFTGVGEMGRMIEYKEKSAKIGDERVSIGLLNYPVLQAADILLYGATYVPVGDDQRQHLEYARHIGERINSRFDDILTVPYSTEKQFEFFGKGQGLRIKDLQIPEKKMSKSADSDKGVIFLTDTPEAAAKKVMSAATDDKASVNYDPAEQPGISNLLQILSLLRGQALDDTELEFKGQSSYGDFKRTVADEVESFLTEFQTKLAAVDDSAITAAFVRSEAVANQQANETLLRVQQAVGLRPRS